ncbi:hypothetical protein ACTXN4_26735 [Pseudomonas helleri]|uniref:hypothetical protein n=1 Tax=Pseudomonas helleri TaxID=1608996 RepID=UPI003FD5A099
MKISPSYLADFMLIKLPPNLSHMVSTDDGLDLSNPFEASLFLHEWAHYIHNISTLNGMYLFSSMLTLWSDFRWKLDRNGSASADEKLHKGRIFNVLRAHGHIKKSRLTHPTPALLEERRFDAKVLSIGVITAPLIPRLPRFQERSTTIKLKLDVGGEKVDAAIGVVEILECLAYSLEERYLRDQGELPTAPKIAPYQLVSKFAQHIAPNIQSDDIIRVCICSLQTADPALDLYQFLLVCSAKPLSEIRGYLEEQSRSALKANSDNIENMLKMVQDLFPLVEPMAISVWRLTLLMQTYLKRRQIHPFFELELLDDAKALDEEVRSQLLGVMIAKSSVCRMYLTRNGDPDQVLRDDIASFKYHKDLFRELEFGYNKLHASFHYTMLHLDGKAFRNEDSLAKLKSDARICPFYSACPYDLRKNEPSICKSTPWKSLSRTVSVGNSCWYREGVRATRRPDDEG